MQDLLQQLKDNGVPMHAVTNYPVWYHLIEDKLQLSRYMPWTFASCEGPMKVQLHSTLSTRQGNIAAIGAHYAWAYRGT